MRIGIALSIAAVCEAGCAPTARQAPPPPLLYDPSVPPDLVEATDEPSPLVSDRVDTAADGFSHSSGYSGDLSEKFRPNEAPLFAPVTEPDADGFVTVVSDQEIAQRIAQASAFSLGSAENPVRALLPMGQMRYLSRLRCEDGRRPVSERVGNVGRGPFGYIVDLYAVDCGAAAPGKTRVYMDMYHDHIETEPVEGFNLKN